MKDIDHFERERGVLTIFVVCSLLGCPRSNDEPRPDHPNAKASSEPSATPSASAAPTGLLPPLETACANDADCTQGWTYEIDGKCCDGTCTPKATTKAWVDRVSVICQKAGHAPKCPEKKCAKPPPVLCESGQCKFGPGVDPKW